MKWSEKPVIVLGHGARASDADASPLLEMGVPVLSSWQAADLVDNTHTNYYGRPGIYGQRTANKILYEADSILAIGCRMCTWMIGHAGLRPEQRLVMVDIDGREVARHKQADHILMDAGEFIRMMAETYPRYPGSDWNVQCDSWRLKWPLLEHEDANGYMNSYRIMDWVNNLLRPDEIIVIDNGSIMCPIMQVMKFKPPQRVITAGCLGEMGCALPGAIGASFARGKGEVLAIIGDGGMMMNIQDLATVAHHKLPIKMMVFENDGYAMIKGTYTTMKKERVGVDEKSGLKLPDFCGVATGFGIDNCDVKTWGDLIHFAPKMFAHKGPFLMQVHIDPEQDYVPRLKPIVGADGTISPPRFDQLSPIV